MSKASLKVRGYFGKGFANTCIRWFTRGSYSHVSFIVTRGALVVEYEAIQGSGVVSGAPKSNAGEFDEYLVPVSEEQICDVVDRLMDLVGSRYDWKGIWSFLLKSKKHREDKWFCSELVAYILLKVGYPISRRAPFRETPSSVMASLRLLDS